MRRWQLSKRDRRRLVEELAAAYPKFQLPSDARVEKAVVDGEELIIIDGLPAFIRIEGRWVPHLLYLLRRGYDWLPYVVVDEGAVKPISRGANLMRPGIIEFHGDFSKGDVIVVAEPSRRLPLALHEALMSRAEAEASKRGVVSRKLHHVGDKYWRLADEIMG